MIEVQYGTVVKATRSVSSSTTGHRVRAGEVGYILGYSHDGKVIVQFSSGRQLWYTYLRADTMLKVVEAMPTVEIIDV